MMSRIFLGAVVLLLAMTGAALSEPKRVLIVYSFGRDFSPWDEYAKDIREELRRQSKDPIDIFETSLATARSAGNNEAPFVDYLNALFSEHRLDLVMTIGAPAARFFQQNRQKLFTTVPTMYAALEQRISPNAPATDTMVSVSIDVFGVLDHILRVLPDTTSVAVVIGNSPLEKRWLEEMRKLFQPLTNRVALTYFNELSFEEMLKRAATLPPRSAIIFAHLTVDAAGVTHEGGKAMERLHAVANAPIFIENDAFFGHGIVGGPMTVIADVCRQIAGVAVRILGGESPGNIKTPPIGSGTPKYDWRELQRWNISESRLPSGSEIHFRTPGIWEQYRLQLTVGLAALLLQAIIISWLLFERRRRHLAQAEASSRRREVIRLNRIATANVLSSSIAHELKQPLGAILINTEAAQMLLDANPPDIAQVREILSDIVRDEQRADEIILGLRNLLNNKNRVELQAFDLNNTVQEVSRFFAAEAAKRKINVNIDCTLDALPVRADPIHMQQVMINLVMNGMDAMEDGDPGPRDLQIRTLRNKLSGTAEVTVSDSGKGIPSEHLMSVFEAFFTTKPHGTGLGLPIARTIMESYEGTIWAENLNNGAAFCFSLPLAKQT